MASTGSNETERLAATLIAVAYGFEAEDAEDLLDDPTGVALLTLLANAGAKAAEEQGDHQLAAMRYQHKAILLRRAIRRAGDWWATSHAYGQRYGADTVVYVETPFARFAFHCHRADPHLADLLQSAPTSERGWSGQPLQPYAAQLVRAYLDGIQTAAEVIQQHAL